MDPLNYKRAGALALLGVLIGFGAAQLVEKTDWNPLTATLLCFIGAGLAGLALRRCEFLNFVVEDAVFAYGTYAGMSLVRAAGHNFLATGSPFHYSFGIYDGTAFLGGFNIIVALAGLPYTFAAVLIAGVPAWALGQRSGKVEEDERFWEFVRGQNRER